MNHETKIKFTRQVMWISGIFCLVVAVLLVANFIQLQKSDPLESKTMEALVERLSAEPNNEELKEEIRQFDLLARKAYFAANWQVQTGALLLLIGGIVFVVAFRVNTDSQKKINPPESHDENPLMTRFITHRWLLISGILLFLFALVAAYFSNDHLTDYLSGQTTAAVPSSTDEEIEVIGISESPSAPEGETSVGSDTMSNEKEEEQETAEAATREEVTEKPSIRFYGLEEYTENQATFRGLFGHGISYHKNIPTEWDGASGKNIKWKVALTKPGYNSPVIWGDKIFIAGGDVQSRIVNCFDRNTGQLLWEKEVTNIPGSPPSPPKVTDDTGFSAPTMAVDGFRVYAIFATGNLIAFDLDGNRIWARNLGVPDNHYGHSSSLMVWQDKLVVQYDTNKGGRMLAVNTGDGNTIWDISRDNNISWSSPILLQKDGGMQIITTTDPFVAGYDLESGEEIWKVDALMGEVGPSAAYTDGLVFATNEYARTVAVKPEKGSQIIWEDNYYMPEASSPVAHNGLLFLGTSYGDLVCHDAQTGEMYWEHHFDRGFYASPMIAEGKIYIIDMDGVMHIVKADQSGGIINEPELGEESFATPAFANGTIYLRSSKALFCIEEE